MSKITPPEELADQELEPLMTQLLEDTAKTTFVADDVSLNELVAVGVHMNVVHSYAAPISISTCW